MSSITNPQEMNFYSKKILPILSGLTLDNATRVLEFTKSKLLKHAVINTDITVEEFDELEST